MGGQISNNCREKFSANSRASRSDPITEAVAAYNQNYYPSPPLPSVGVVYDQYPRHLLQNVDRTTISACACTESFPYF
jgi:hypothetical protein